MAEEYLLELRQRVLLSEEASAVILEERPIPTCMLDCRAAGLIGETEILGHTRTLYEFQ